MKRARLAACASKSCKFAADRWGTAVGGNSEEKRAQEFYDNAYYTTGRRRASETWHSRQIVNRVGDLHDKSVLDVGCGMGQWLQLLGARGALLSGIDISTRAVEICRSHVSGADIRQGSAESLPWADATFDLVTCLGSLEHFAEKSGALAEMVRVGRTRARYLILVPNAGFLTRRLGLYAGTQQTEFREDVYSLDAWAALFRGVGLVVEKRWRDLHMLDLQWITSGPFSRWALRSVQAAALPLWPLGWQYQVYHLCAKA